MYQINYDSTAHHFEMVSAPRRAVENSIRTVYNFLFLRKCNFSDYLPVTVYTRTETHANIHANAYITCIQGVKYSSLKKNKKT